MSEVIYCNDKVTHLSFEAAQDAQSSLAEKMGVVPNIYECERCGYWHVGYDAELRKQFSPAAQRIYEKAHK